MSRRRAPQYVLYSGYELSREDFQTFIRSIPRLHKYVEPTGRPYWDFEACIHAYWWWVEQVGDPSMPRLIGAILMYYYMTGSSF
jgi:hypothetical protein